jgi:exonuclease III
MRIVTWNCQGAYRKKAKAIANYKPDIAIIQECEAPEKLKFKSDIAAPHFQLWFGENRNKGLGIFSYTDLEFEPWPTYDRSIKYCVPLKVRGCYDFNLIAVWAMGHPDPKLSYIGQVYLAIEKYRDFIRQTETMLIGDFNSNKRWDSAPKIGGGNHSRVVEMLASQGIVSVYHAYFGEQQGEERQNTLYMYRNQDKGYHIDYCFVPRNWVERVKAVRVGVYEAWRALSDHSPVFVEFEG